MKIEVREDVLFLSRRFLAWVSRFLTWVSAALIEALAVAASALVKVVVRVALMAALFLAPQALAAGQMETEPQVAQVAAAPPSAPAESPVEPAIRIAQAPSGDAPATKNDIRWQSEQNERLWNKMSDEMKEFRAESRAESRALRADLSSFKDTVILLLGGLLASHLALLGVALVALLRSREKSPQPGAAPKSEHSSRGIAQAASLALLAVLLLSGGVSSVHAQGAVDRASDAQVDRFILCNQALEENASELARFVDSFRHSLRRLTRDYGDGDLPPDTAAKEIPLAVGQICAQQWYPSCRWVVNEGQCEDIVKGGGGRSYCIRCNPSESPKWP